MKRIWCLLPAKYAFILSKVLSKNVLGGEYISWVQFIFWEPGAAILVKFNRKHIYFISTYFFHSNAEYHCSTSVLQYTVDVIVLHKKLSFLILKVATTWECNQAALKSCALQWPTFRTEIALITCALCFVLISVCKQKNTYILHLGEQHSLVNKATQICSASEWRARVQRQMHLGIIPGSFHDILYLYALIIV